MDQGVENLTLHRALEDIVPCIDSATTSDTLIRSKEVTFLLVNLVNQLITIANNPVIPLPRLFYNQSGPIVPVLCNPYNLDTTHRKCVSGEVHFTNASQVWRRSVCEVSDAGICTTVGRLTPDYYHDISVAANVSFGLYLYGPFLVELEDCSTVMDIFTHSHNHLCHKLTLYSKMIFIGLALLSLSVMLSLVCWLIFLRERVHRVYTATARMDRQL